MKLLELFELLSYVVTVVGLPFAILVFMWEQRKERQNDQEEIYQRLSDEYTEFLKLVLVNADLRMLSRPGVEANLNEEQLERRNALMNVLVSLFERAYMLVFEEKMDRQTRRLWQSWEDYMREWCRRPEFRAALPEMLKGEDDDFQAHIKRIAADEEVARLQATQGGAAARPGR